MNKIIQNNTRVASYEYNLDFSGYGGEIVVGEVTNDLAKFWQERNHLELYGHVFDFLGFQEFVPENPDYDLSAWFEIDDLVHVSGIDLSDEHKLNVSDPDGNIIVTADFWNGLIPVCSMFGEFDVSELDPKKSYLTVENYEKWVQRYAISSNRPFDIDRLHIKYFGYGERQIIDCLLYDGNEIEPAFLYCDAKTPPLLTVTHH